MSYSSWVNKWLKIRGSMKPTAEQLFQVARYAMEVELMPPDEVKPALIALYQRMVVRDAMYKEELKRRWGI